MESRRIVCVRDLLRIVCAAEVPFYAVTSSCGVTKISFIAERRRVGLRSQGALANLAHRCIRSRPCRQLECRFSGSPVLFRLLLGGVLSVLSCASHSDLRFFE